MGRKGKVKLRKITPDPLYRQEIVAKLINQTMRDGKKEVAQRKVYAAFELIKKKTQKDPLEVFQKALDNIRPKMEVRSRRVGGAAYQVPSLVRGRRGESLALRWLVDFARERANKDYHSFEQKLATEIMEAAQKTGGAAGKKEEVEKIAEANRVFSHLHW